MKRKIGVIVVNCVNCNMGLLEPHDKLEIPGEFRDLTTTVIMPGVRCSECGFVTIDGSQMAEYMRLVADAYRRAVDLLTSDDIRARRKSLKMNQDKFAKYLGVGTASIKRWEMGQIQDLAMDYLIRIKTDPVAAWSNYC